MSSHRDTVHYENILQPRFPHRIFSAPLAAQELYGCGIKIFMYSAAALHAGFPPYAKQHRVLLDLEVCLSFGCNSWPLQEQSGFSDVAIVLQFNQPVVGVRVQSDRPVSAMEILNQIRLQHLDRKLVLFDFDEHFIASRHRNVGRQSSGAIWSCDVVESDQLDTFEVELTGPGPQVRRGGLPAIYRLAVLVDAFVEPTLTIAVPNAELRFVAPNFEAQAEVMQEPAARVWASSDNAYWLPYVGVPGAFDHPNVPPYGARANKVEPPREWPSRLVSAVLV